jgi:hypothetical protein
MPILDTFRKDSWGSWKSLPEYTDLLGRRDTAALAALGAALGMEPPEQKELGAAAPALLVELAADLKQQKGTRLAAARCVLEAGADEKQLSDLLLAAGDLLTDPRLGKGARALAEGGIPAALRLHREFEKVAAAAGDFARAAFSASSVVGAARIKELLAPAGQGNAGANAARFALGEPLPEADAQAWQKLLSAQCAAYKKAPAAAKRMGMVAPWPPFLPEPFGPLIKAAEEATQSVTTVDALASKRPPAPPKGSKVVEAPGGVAPAQPGPAAAAAPEKPAPVNIAAPPPQQQPGRNFSSQVLSTGAKAMAPINRMPRPRAAVLMEGPGLEQRGGEKKPAPEKTMMPAITPRTPGLGNPLSPEGARAALEKVAAAAEASAAGRTSLAGTVFDPLAGVAALQKDPMSAKLSAGTLQQMALERGLTLPDGRTYKGADPLGFDARGRRLPRSDRWRDDAFEWQEPILPKSAMKPPATSRVVQGPFALRLQSLFENRPEAVDRLCAAAEAQALLTGEEEVLVELARECSLSRWRRRTTPPEQLDRLRKLAASEERPAASRAVARSLAHQLDRPPEELAGKIKEVVARPFRYVAPPPPEAKEALSEEEQKQVLAALKARAGSGASVRSAPQQEEQEERPRERAPAPPPVDDAEMFGEEL